MKQEQVDSMYASLKDQSFLELAVKGFTRGMFTIFGLWFALMIYLVTFTVGYIHGHSTGVHLLEEATTPQEEVK